MSIDRVRVKLNSVVTVCGTAAERESDSIL